MQLKHLMASLVMAASAVATINYASAASMSPAIGAQSCNVALAGADSAGFGIIVASRFDAEPQNDPEAELEAELMLLSSPDLVNRPKR